MQVLPEGWILTGPAADAYDVQQEVFMRLWRYGARYREAQSKVGFLYRITDRCCLDLIARLKRKYGERLADVLSYLQQAELELAAIEDSEQQEAVLAQAVQEAREVAAQAGLRLDPADEE